MTADSLRPVIAKLRLAIIGGGSSGLICLKTALAELPGWEIVCFEKSSQITGCWGNPYPGFVSTSTKYTTQFGCFREHDAEIESDSGRSRAEFYRDGEYGEYLTRFADAFQLREHIKLNHQVERLDRDVEQDRWLITYCKSGSDRPVTVTERFDAVVICTGLAAQAKAIESPVPAIPLDVLNIPGGIARIRNERVVVFGGGESAVDYATRLSQPELGNRVYLSLRTGVRVSPRYHPIRGVPSDFLRNRLMLSIDPALRNWIGQRFVEARILYQDQFEKWFPSRQLDRSAENDDDVDCENEHRYQSLRKEWAYKLTKAAKDELFNMFHNKSDDFLDCVARGRITIVGPPVDGHMESFYEFQSTRQIEVRPTKIVPAIGYRSTLPAIAGDSCRLTDFYLGCSHVTHSDLYLIGFARPIIGNIPTISEIQAAYVCGLIAGRFARPERIVELNSINQKSNAERFSKVDLGVVYPVEMFSYCDELARTMNRFPSLWKIGSLRSWWHIQRTPATTMHYQFDNREIRRFFERAPVYMPTILVLLLLLLKPLDWSYRVVKRLL